MDRKLQRNRQEPAPFVHEEDGELSLYFGFPTIQSRMLKSAPEELLLDYTRTMMGFLLFQPEPKRIAMIGLGGGSLAKYCRRRLPATDFTAVEISHQVVALRREFGIPDDGPLFRVVAADGADFVRRQRKTFDVLLIDGFDSSGQPETLCSPAFYDCCRDCLRRGGVLAVNLCADDNACGVYLDRIRTAFSGKAVAVDADDGGNTIVFACKGRGFPLPLAVLAGRLAGLEAAHPVELASTAQKILVRQP